MRRWSPLRGGREMAACTCLTLHSDPWPLNVTKTTVSVRCFYQALSLGGEGGPGRKAC